MKELRAEEPRGVEQVKDTGRRCSGNKATCGEASVWEEAPCAGGRVRGQRCQPQAIVGGDFLRGQTGYPLGTPTMPEHVCRLSEA